MLTFFLLNGLFSISGALLEVPPASFIVLCLFLCLHFYSKKRLEPLGWLLRINVQTVLKRVKAGERTTVIFL